MDQKTYFYNMGLFYKTLKFLAGCYEGFLEIFGADSLRDLLHSIVILKYLKGALLCALIFGSFEQFIQAWMGMRTDVYVLFVIGIFMDTFITFYILLFVDRKKGVNKTKLLGKSVFKVFVYSFLFVMLHRFKLNFATLDILKYQFNVFEWINKVVLTFIFIQLILGIVSKAGDAGFEEINGLLKVLQQKLRFTKQVDNEEGSSKKDKDQ